MDDQLNYEKCTFNRSDRTITSELVDVLPNGDTKTLEKSVYQPDGDDTVQNHFVFQHGGFKSYKVEIFKMGVEKLLKAMRFSEWDDGTA